MKIFSGRSNQDLALSLSRELNTTVGEIEIHDFVNGESRIFIKEKNIGPQAVVVQSLNAPVEKNLVELAFMCDALTRLGVKDITAVIPWLGYSKQDKVFRNGESLSVKVIAKMIQVVPIKHIITFDLHNLAILGFFDVPLTNLSARELFLNYFRKIKTDKTVIVAPDEGAVKNSTAFSHELDIPIIYMDKKRDLVTGEVKINGMSRSPNGCDAIIIDDMIITGSTLIETAKYLKSNGAMKVYVGATHHLYVPGAQEKITSSGIDKVVVTNTIKKNSNSNSLEVIEVSPLIANALGEVSHDWSGL